ncbi:MAG: hypothetical protein JRF72_21690 [Deltaproteobacteria bacterium]|jgi:hypothetical protein|nr:hypothetical protein [Deltaproteobacteria bacterium]
MVGIIACASPTKKADSSPRGNNSEAHSIIWFELLQKTPYPHTAPLPPQRPTVLDGFYTKFDPKKTPPVACRRCPDYVPEGGIWKLNLDKGIYRIFHEFTGWRSIGSFVVDGNRVQLFNDPTCMQAVGTYIWTAEIGTLNLQVIEDECAIRMRGKNLTQFPWTLCPPSSVEAGTSTHRNRPFGCD